MSLKSLLALCVFLFASVAAASDYDLIVPSGWDYLKAAKTLVVYAPGGTLKPGDKIARIVPGGADGPGVRVSAGWTSDRGMELAKAGTVEGFYGSIILSTDNTGANGLAAVLVPAGQGATSPPEDGIAKTSPWLWAVVGGGILVLLATGGTLFRRSVAPAVPMRFTGRKGIEQGVREIRSKIDEIQAEQQQLVRKPPVLRSFKKQIEAFDHKLGDLDGAAAETRQQLSAISAALQKLDDRLNTIAQHSVNASTDSRKAIEMVSKASGEQSARSSQLEEQVSRLAAGQESLGSISRDVSKSLEGIAGLSGRIDALAAQNHSHETRLQNTGALVEEAKVRLEKVESRLAESAQAAEAAKQQVAASDEATRKELSGVLSGLDGAAKRIAALEGEVAHSARRDEESARLLNDAVLASKLLEQGVSQLDQKFDSLSKGIESVQVYLHEVHGRLTNAEGSLQANFQDLASELGTLRNEVGSLPQAMTSIGERVGSLDARLAPMSERGDRLAETLHALQSRFEEASVKLASQFDTLDTRMEQIRAEGSRLANLPEVANALHGNTAELAEHVRSAETGLRSLGDELAKIQEALRNDNRQSDVLADELAQRLEAWEGALAHVASKVEDLSAAELQDEESEAPKPRRMKGKATKSRPVDEASEDRADLAQPEGTLIIEDSVPRAEAPVAVPGPALQEAAEAEELPEPAVEALPAPTEEIVFVEAEKESAPQAAEPAAEAEPEVPQVHAPFIFEEPSEEEEDEFVLAKSKVGSWTELGGSSERLWSIKLPGTHSLPDVRGPVRPMTPIETPGIDSQIGALICTGQGTAYVHGSMLRSFWPGTESRNVQLQSPMPNDPWRLMMYGGYMYCAAERQVDVIHLSTWTRHAFFQGDYLGQVHTDVHWVGLMAWGDKLAVDFRDALGNHIISPRELPAGANEQFHLAASGSSAYVGTRSGSIFRVQTADSVEICRSSDNERLLSLSLTKSGILAMIQGENGVASKLLSPEGHLLKDGHLGCQVMAHAPVVMGDTFYVFDDCLGELVAVNLKSLQVTSRLSLESVLGVSRIVGLACGKTPLLAMLATDDRGQPSRAFVLDLKTGREMTLCPINHPRAEMVAGDGHLVITTSSAYQNTIQVFDPFDAVEVKAKRAA